jgi:hypothetical protein
MRLGLTLAVALGVACTGSEGTLLVRHEGSEGGASSPPEIPWIPDENARWLARLDGAVDIEQAADFFYLDPEQQPASDLATLQASGRHYFCYMSAGSLESFRPDADAFPSAAVGNPLAAFPNERWLDVREPAVRELMARRIATLAAAGCDGVAPAALAGYAAESGFELTLADSLDYARWVAERVHASGMSVGLAGPAAMISELWPTFDFGLAIACVTGSGCQEFAPLVQAAKPVLHVELGEETQALGLCKSAEALGFDALVSDAGFAGRCVVCRDIL